MDCRFCDLLRQKSNDTLIAKMNYGKLFLNYNQYFSGRVMYVINKHYKDVTEIDVAENCFINKELIIVAKAIKDIFSPDLINVASLGNHVQHLHWHIIPRYKSEPEWGSPPWPHGAHMLTQSELKEKSVFIRNHLMKHEGFLSLNIPGC